MEPIVCNSETVTGSWAAFSWSAFRVLLNPTIVILLLLGCIGLPWLIKPLRWKRPVSALGVGLLVVYLLVTSPILSAIGSSLLVGFLPADSGAAADAIVVLGRGANLRPERTEVAALLWRAKRAPIVFVSGHGDAIEIDKLLTAKGLPQQAVSGEDCSHTTEENARNTAAILKPRNVQQIILVTDPPHMLRSLLTFQSFGFEVIPHISPFPRQFNSREKALLVFREFLGIASYGLRGRFSPRAMPTDVTALTTPLNFAAAHEIEQRHAYGYPAGDLL